MKKSIKFLTLNIFFQAAGILASLYCSQIICLYSRKRATFKRWTHLNEFLQDRSLRQAIQSASIHQRSYVPSNDENHWYRAYAEQIRNYDSFMPLKLVPVVNTIDDVKQNQHFDRDNITFTTATQTTEDVSLKKNTHSISFFAKFQRSFFLFTRNQQKVNLSLAVDDLIATLGSIEFQLGMQNLRAEEPEAAVSHLKSATTHRHPEATFNLGVCYELGIGVEKNMKNAMECYRQAASLGHMTAMYNLGVFYVHGRGGLKKNHDAARACFETASKMGLRRAKKALAIPEEPIVNKDEDISWKSNSMASKLSAVHRRRESSVI